MSKNVRRCEDREPLSGVRCLRPTPHDHHGSVIDGVWAVWGEIPATTDTEPEPDPTREEIRAALDWLYGSMKDKTAPWYYDNTDGPGLSVLAWAARKCVERT